MRRGFLLFVLIGICGCSNNLLTDLGSKSSDEALLFDAQTAVNVQRYQEAIDIITQRMSSAGQAKTKAREVLASGYAGRCGLNFVNYTDSLANATSGTAFQLMSGPFVGKTVDPASCLLSLQTLDLIGTTAQRTSDENTFASIVGMVLLGSATRLYTDNNPVNGDGIQDSVGVSCTVTDTQIDYVVLGYAYMAQNFSALASSQIGSGSQSTISGSITICESIAGNLCTNTNPNLIDSTIRNTMRDLLNTQQYGVGTYNASNPALIPASCP